MIHFVFDWVPGTAFWSGKMSTWYRDEKQLVFNESVEYVKRFAKQRIDYQALIVHYAPQFRYFIQSQGIATLEYWSVFDWIQGVDLNETNPIDYLQLAWPETVEFLYNPFAILALLQGELFAKIEFGNEGQLLWIDYYQGGRISERHQWDDRGFISSVLKFNANNQIVSCDYLDLSGNWVLREINTENQQVVEVNPDYSDKFLTDRYGSMGEIIDEIIGNHAYKISEADSLVLPYKAEVLTVFEKTPVIDKILLVNYALDLSEELVTLDPTIKQIVVSNYEHMAIFEGVAADKRVHFMPPVDTRVQLGHSNRIKEEILLIILDSKALKDFQLIAKQLEEMIKLRDDIRVHFVLVNGVEQTRVELIARLETSGLVQLNASRQLEANNSYDLPFDDGELLEDIIIEPTLLRSEVELIEKLRFTRLVIDLSEKQNDYVKLSSISAGIPMILNKKSIYVEHMENGWILEDLSQLSQAIAYYSSTLNSWNKASIAAMKKSQRFVEEFNVDKLFLAN